MLRPLQILKSTFLVTISSLFLWSPSALAVAPNPGTVESQAEAAAQERLLNSDMRTVSSPIADASKCGIKGSATLVEVQVARDSKTTSSDGKEKDVKTFETIKAYIVSPGFFSNQVVDADSCSK